LFQESYYDISWQHFCFSENEPNISGTFINDEKVIMVPIDASNDVASLLLIYKI
jgi:hypothetical protein